MAVRQEARKIRMKRLLISSSFGALLALGWVLSSQAPSVNAQAVSGNGKYKFRVLYTSSHLPSEAQTVLKGAHGGFTVDLRPGKGETYFSLKGAGIIQISSDLKSTRMIATDPQMKGTNLHNTTIHHTANGNSFLLFPGNEAGRVFVTSVDGKLLIHYQS